MISSPSNQHVALLRSLQTAKGRETEGAFLIEGPHLLAAALDAHVTPRLVLYHPEELARDVTGRQTLGRIQEARAAGATVLEANAVAIERASDARTPQGVVAAIAVRDVAPEQVRTRRRGRFRPLLLVLDAISDPGNMGTILRSALAADADEVVLAPGCVHPLSPKVVRAGAGAHFHLPLREAQTWGQISDILAGDPSVTQVLAAEASARRPYDSFDLTRRTVLIVGNEAHGLSSQSLSLITERVSIPMWNHVESLNAAIATSVIVFEAARQRRANEAAEQSK